MKGSGRPLKGATKRDKNVQMRISQEDYNKIQELSNEFNINKTDTIIAAVDMMYDDTFNNNNEDC